MKVNCLGCGHMVDIFDSYDDYSGVIRCNICGALMDIASKEGALQSVRLIDPVECPGEVQAIEGKRKTGGAKRS